METDVILTMDTPRIANAMQKAHKASRWMSGFLAQYTPPMDGERYLTDKEVADILKLSRRTLQIYRTNRILPYIMLGGKALYPESKIREALEKAYKRAIT